MSNVLKFTTKYANNSKELGALVFEHPELSLKTNYLDIPDQRLLLCVSLSRIPLDPPKRSIKME